MLVIRACIKVDLPEPVRPASRTCCDVPWPSVRCCALGRPRLAQRDIDARSAVARPPLGLRRGDELEGNLDAAGVLRRGPHALDLPRGEVRGGRLVEGQRMARRNRGSGQASRAPSQVRPSQYGRSSSSEKSAGIGPRDIGRDEHQHAAWHARRRRSPPAAPRPSRRSWPGSRRSPRRDRARRPRRPPRCTPRASAYSLRRYFCVTISMCAARSASRSSICRGSVQTWLVDQRAVEVGQVHERAEAPADPHGSTIVNRTMPGGRLVSSRSIEAWSTLSASARPSGGCSMSRLAWAGNGRKRGEREPRAYALHQPGIGRDAARQVARCRAPPRRAGSPAGWRAGASRDAQTGSSQRGP